MPTRHSKICGCGCGGVTNGDAYLPGHNRNARSRDRQASRLPTWEPRWKKFTLYLRNLSNVLCQFVDEQGIRCGQPVWGFHHILPAEKYPQFATEWRNVVGVCLSCHNKAEMNPGRSRFVPTLYRTAMSDEPIPKLLFPPGEKVPPDAELWTPENRLVVLLEGATGCPSTF